MKNIEWLRKRQVNARRPHSNHMKHNSKLTAKQVQDIRYSWDSRTETQTAIAKRIGVSQSIVNLVCLRLSYTHIKE